MVILDVDCCVVDDVKEYRYSLSLPSESSRNDAIEIADIGRLVSHMRLLHGR